MFRRASSSMKNLFPYSELFLSRLLQILNQHGVAYIYIYIYFLIYIFIKYILLESDICVHYYYYSVSIIYIVCYIKCITQHN